MPRAYPPEFRHRAVELARLREKPIAHIAADLGIAGSCLHRWLRQADVDEGRTEGLTSDERAELVRLRRPCARLRARLSRCTFPARREYARDGPAVGARPRRVDSGWRCSGPTRGA